MVITQQAAQPLAALNRPLAAGVCTPRKQQDIALPLVIPFGMEVFDIFSQRAPQRALTDSQLLAQKIVASGTRRGYTGNGQLTVFSTVLIF
jgi:hypothetical protein